MMSGDPQARAARRPELDSVTSGDELARLLAEQYARADASLRELELRASRAGGARLPRATCSDMLAGRRFPKKAVMVAFLRACRVPEEQIPDWERAWERVKIAQMSAAQAARMRLAEADRDGAAPLRHSGEPEGGGAAARRNTGPLTGAPAGGRRPAWRRIAASVGLAAVAGVAAAIAYSTLIGTGAPHHHTLIDDGRAFGGGGSSRFTVTVDPAHTEIRLTRRLDAAVARQTATVTVDGSLAAVWQPLHGESQGWKEQSVVLPAALTAGRSRLTITNTFVSSALDFNEFAYFVDQKVGGAWSRADTVDIGPNHPDSEAAHRYRIANQTWYGTRHLRHLK
ncbi:hypothetical protein [Actinomadura keratinilytica]|uniref:XRE family transcriptional regulator n=1 Tax=Actinomadura keratinilytica TaxID=547461 RepID=A0ABP7Y6G9_9ACTN